MQKLLNVKKVADYLAITVDTVYRKARAGELPGMRIGRSWRFPKKILDDWLKETVKKNLKSGKRHKYGEKK